MMRIGEPYPRKFDKEIAASHTMNQFVIPWPTIPQWRKFFFYFSLIVITIYFAWIVRAIWVPLGLACILAMVLDPVVDRMEKRGWSRLSATAFIFGSFVILLGCMLWLAIPHLFAEIALVQKIFAKYFPDTSHEGLVHSFHVLKVPDSLTGVGVHTIENTISGVQRSSSWITEYGMNLLSNLVWVVIIPIVAFYALKDFHLILGKAMLLVPRNRRPMAQTYVTEVTTVFSKYLRGLAIVSGLNGVFTWMLLQAIGVPSALVLGISAGVLYSVPYIGAFITVGLTAIAAFVGGGTQLMLLAVGLSMVLHQVIFDQIVTPRLLGKQVGLHPILSIVALLSGNLLLGIVGMILAVPVAACIQIGILALIPKLSFEMNVSEGQTAMEAVKEVEQAVQASVELGKSPTEELSETQTEEKTWLPGKTQSASES